MFDLNALRQLDWLLVVAMVLVIAAGLVVISSAASTDVAKKQAVFAIMGLFVFVFFACFDYHWFRKASVWIYPLALAALVAVLFIGGGRGARRWFALPFGFALQPSEFTKLGTIILVAFLLDRFRAHRANILYMLVPLVLFLLPMALIAKQPDLGTALAMMPALFGMLYVAGARKRYVLLVIAVGLLALPVLWIKMEPYQKKRVFEFLTVPQRRVMVRLMTSGDRERLRERLAREFDPSGHRSLDELVEAIRAGWNSEQSKIAVASGSVSGRGYGKGPQVQYDFLPAAHTDFIFPVLGEEWGFLGCLFVLALYFLVLERGLRIASQAVDTYGRFLACGIVVLFASHILINVAMAIGLLPITGLPLPLLSYGGSSLLMTMGSIGILQSIHTRRHYFKSGKYALDTRER
ncbi:MAG: rod shape-determining protein RodA [Verrucomicrobia bacterium]|nr:rod shape-determining protein RodA [Verrucomicrobiota bacterium]